MPEFKFELYIGGMGAGKTTLMKQLGGFDTDCARAAVYEPMLKKYRRARNWQKHNEIWFPEIWGAIWALAPSIVADHGGWFVINLNAWEYVTKVTWLKVDVDVAVERVKARDGAKAETSLVRLSNENMINAVAEFKKHGIPVIVSETQAGSQGKPE
jgi:shikimate kinase